MGCWFFSEPNVAIALALALLLSNAPLSSSDPAAPPPRDYAGENGDDHSVTSDLAYIFMAYGLPLVLVLLFVTHLICDLLKQRTVVRVQIVLSARGGDLGSALLDIAASARDGTESLKGTIKALVGGQQNFIYGSTSVQVRRGITYHGLKRHLGNLASKEMEKLEIQRVRLKNGLMVPTLGPKQNKDYTLVTILVAVHGAHQLPSTDSSSEEMKDALSYLDTKLNEILMAEVIWGYKDPFPAHGLLETYPDLKSFLA